MTEQEWWDKAEQIANELAVSFDSNEVANAADNSCDKDDNGMLIPVFTQASLDMFAAGLEAIVKGY